MKRFFSLALVLLMLLPLCACAAAKGTEPTPHLFSSASGSENEDALNEPTGTAGETGGFAEVYISVFDSYFDFDKALHEDIKFVALDLDELEYASGADKQAVAQHLEESLSVEFIDADMDALKEQGLVKEFGYIEGILLSVQSVKIEGESMTIEGYKYRSGDGANGFLSFFDLKDGVWFFNETGNTWIS